MRIRIVIDTQDADDPAALDTRTPFTLNVYHDDDGTPSQENLQIGTEMAIIGNDIAVMLDELRIAWTRESVLDQDDEPVPRTGEQWRETTAGTCDECDQQATRFWPDLTTPVQMCDSCTHNAFRSGWEPGA